jgi:DNA/RNA endonuclease YhcR with UshA esterase domain
MKGFILPSLLAISLIPSGVAYAHHSFAATYFVDQDVTIKGTITQFLYRNPHSFLKVEVKDANGQVTPWSIEWGGGAQLAQDKVDRDTLKAGDVVTVEGNPGRDPAEHRIRVKKIVRLADGWKWEGVVI